MNQYDIIVLGAGVAGLAAAEVLGNAGLRVAVLEARDRVGGRIHSLPGLTPDHAIELGAEFVHGKPPLFDDYLRTHQLPLYETDGVSYCTGASGLEPCGGPELDIFSELDQMNLDDFPDEPFDATLRRRFADAPDEDKRWARAFVQGFHAADPARISTHSIIRDSRAEEETEGMRGFHIAGGYRRLIETLCASLSPSVELLTATTVTSVDWSQDPVVVQARRSSGETLACQAPRVVITLPLGVLQQRPPAPGAVRFQPELTEKQDALSKLVMGPALRISLQFDSLFWEDPAVMGVYENLPPQNALGAAQQDLLQLSPTRADQLSPGREPWVERKISPSPVGTAQKLTRSRMAPRTLPNLHFLFTSDPVFPTWWSTMPLRLPVLVAWAGGPFAEAKFGLSQAQIEAQALAALARILSLPEASLRNRLVRSFLHDWQSDPFSRGAYSYVLAGGMTAQDDLARPLQNRLFFAGEATQSDGHHATVHGAFASGRRAAGEVLEASS